MKWYIGIISEVLATIVGVPTLIYLQDQDIISGEEDPVLGIWVALVFLIGFIGGFVAPYTVRKTSTYTAGTFTILAGVPLVIILIWTGEILGDSNNGDGDPLEGLAVVILLIILIALAIALGLSIVVVTVMLFVGGYVGSIFGKMVFDESQYDLPEESKNKGYKG